MAALLTSLLNFAECHDERDTVKSTKVLICVICKNRHYCQAIVILSMIMRDTREEIEKKLRD